MFYFHISLNYMAKTQILTSVKLKQEKLWQFFLEIIKMPAHQFPVSEHFTPLNRKKKGGFAVFLHQAHIRPGEPEKPLY